MLAFEFKAVLETSLNFKTLKDVLELILKNETKALKSLDIAQRVIHKGCPQNICQN